MMQVGSLVQTKISWDHLATEFGYRYPKMDEILTVRKMYTNEDGMLVLYFEEGYYGPYGYLAAFRFEEVMPPLRLSQLCDLFIDL